MQKAEPNGLVQLRVFQLDGTTCTVSVTRLGDFLQFGQIFKAFGNN